MGSTARFAYEGTASQAVAAGSPILFPRSSGCASVIQGNGAGGILLKSPGAYKVTASFVLDAAAAGTVNIRMSEGTAPAYAARGSATMAAAGDLATVAITDVVRVRKGAGGSYAALTFAPDAAVGIASASVVVEKMCQCV